MNVNLNELNKYWIKIVTDTITSLDLIKKDRERNGLPFDEKFREFFLQSTNARIASAYSQYMDVDQSSQVENGSEVQCSDVRRQKISNEFTTNVDSTLSDLNEIIPSDIETILTTVLQDTSTGYENTIHNADKCIPNGDFDDESFLSYLGKYVNIDEIMSSMDELLVNETISNSNDSEKKTQVCQSRNDEQSVEDLTNTMLESFISHETSLNGHKTSDEVPIKTEEDVISNQQRKRKTENISPNSKKVCKEIIDLTNDSPSIQSKCTAHNANNGGSKLKKEKKKCCRNANSVIDLTADAPMLVRDKSHDDTWFTRRQKPNSNHRLPCRKSSF